MSHPFIASMRRRISSRETSSITALMGSTEEEQFDAQRGPGGALLVGSPQEVIDKLLWEREIFGLQRFLLQLTVGSMSHAQMMRAIELFGTEVVPVVRREATSTASAPSAT